MRERESYGHFQQYFSYLVYRGGRELNDLSGHKTNVWYGSKETSLSKKYV